MQRDKERERARVQKCVINMCDLHKKEKFTGESWKIRSAHNITQTLISSIPLN